ncbi:hypothetical protein AB6A40_000740 [Gnathostoma spinigerum]|uniref:Uncharacterized protein n=1 Tax=Gnathostoma spinigerum TaxID=75299 RepID=A0ABD6E3X6_9BILA
MGLFCCKPTYEMKAEPKEEDVIRFFMIGMGSAGKSTVIRQLMKLCVDFPNSYKMYDDDWKPKENVYSESDRYRWKTIIRQNIVDSFSKAIKQCKQIGLNFTDDEQRSAANEVLNICEESETLRARIPKVYTEEFARKLLLLYGDENSVIRKAFNHRHEFAGCFRYPDGVLHFLNPEKIEAYADETFLPDQSDIIYARDNTSGLDTYKFRVHGTRIEIHDMGGQAVERKKVLEFLSHWISDTKENHLNFILYVASISEYNVQHPVNRQFTLLDESVTFMKLILSLSQVRQCGFLIFLNKCDIFEEKIMDPILKADFRKYLSDYISKDDLEQYEKGQKVHVNKMRTAIANLFAKSVTSAAVKREAPVYHRFTCAVDSKMMESIFSTIRSELLTRKLSSNEWILP